MERSDRQRKREAREYREYSHGLQAIQAELRASVRRRDSDFIAGDAIARAQKKIVAYLKQQRQQLGLHKADQFLAEQLIIETIRDAINPPKNS